MKEGLEGTGEQEQGSDGATGCGVDAAAAVHATSAGRDLEREVAVATVNAEPVGIVVGKGEAAPVTLFSNWREERRW
ncbi:unnamed protein product [Urochloa humidicola]